MTISAVQSFYIPAVAVTTIPGITISNLDSSGLRIDWSVRRDNTNKPDSGEVTVYNLASEVTASIFQSWQAVRLAIQAGAGFGLAFTLAVGWNKVPEILIQGDIITFEPSIRTPTDVLTRWTIGDGTERTRDATVGRDYHNVEISILLEILVVPPPSPDDIGGGGLGLIYLPESEALVKQAVTEVASKGFINWSNVTKGTSTRENVDAIMETLGLEWRIHNGAFVALRGGIINRPGPVISPSSGLISYTVKDDGGIIFSALADSRFEPGIRCTVLDNVGVPIGAPSYRVESSSYTGSTDENSTMEVIGRKPIAL